MQVTTLGPLALDGRPVRGERLAAVVRELVAARGHAVSVRALVEAVWDGAPPDDETGAVQALVSRVRRLGMAVESVPGGYRVPREGLVVDADEVRALVVAARTALAADDTAAARAHATAARALLPATPQDATAVRLLADTADVAARAALRSGGPFDDDDLRLLATRTPPDEPATALLVHVLAAQGRDAEALEVVEALRRDLAERYGTDPSPVVQDAHLALLRGELGRPSATTTPAVPDAPPPGESSPDASPDASQRGPVRLPRAWRRPATPLVGREADVAAVTAALGAGPVVTVVAAGGAGKTRLAAEVARLAAERGESVHVVELAGLRSGDDVLPALLGELGGAETAPTLPDVAERRMLPRLERLRAAAHDLRGLVVLDNCEHVLADAARTVADLLTVAPPDVTVLATSRAPLGLVGERVHRLAALPDDDALALLHARAQDARPGLVWDDERALELCRRLDNLPLALELAAARLRSMPVEDLLHGLADRFALLDDALRGLPERHASLWALVDWSRELLPDDERDLLERLAVVPGAFPASLAAAVAGVDDVRRGLADLVDQSLLALEDAGSGPARYRMLETVREYGEARLAAAGARDDALAGLVTWAARECADLAPRFVGAGQLAALARCDDEAETFVAALRRAVETADDAAAVDLASTLFQWWSVRGMHAEVVTWAERLLHADDPAARRACPLLVGRPGLAPGAHLPDGDRTATVVLQSAMNAGAAASWRATALASRVLRRVLREQPDEVSDRMRALGQVVPALASSATAELDAAAHALVAHDDGYVRALGLFLRGAVRENAGEPLDSAQDARAAFALFEQLGDHWGMGMAAQGVAQWSAAEDAAQAVQWLERGVQHLELVGAAQDARSLRVLLDVQRALDGSTEALDALHETADAPRADGIDVAHALLGLAMVALAGGDRPTAVARALRAAAVVTRRRDPVAQARVVFLVSAAVVLLQATPRDSTDDDEGARVERHVVAVLRDAAADARTLADMPVVGTFALGCAELAAWRGDDEHATTLWALGRRMGATVANAALPLGQPHSLATRAAGEAGERRLDELRARPAAEVDRMVAATADRVLGLAP
ncbi:AfsR/SARP family transcriptional regulator [Cellulomonas uda]|uniref:SARP family transcriptional regulator n=1 Tax=Cellulomonas uda TaxID=1714 RepID=A0A4Y3K6Z0_CELUD|nr:AAA family ATPase [Cellulomonas uda]NII66651.1 putative ATPase [Cellulomonas uda]GEA79697.1 hypothetical protein CUD01_01410 [Cellulomonas uda]